MGWWMMTPDAAHTSPAKEGGTAAIDWSAVLAQHERWLRTVVLSRLGEPQAVDEVMQEVSLAAVAQRAPLQDATKVAPWLYRLAVMQSLLYRRKRGRQKKLADRYAQRVRPGEGESRTLDPLSWLLAAEQRQLIRKAMEQLPPRDAEILLLKYTEDWSYHQLAEHLGISHAAVEARLHRARQKLRSQLAAMHVIEVA
jgi:RNA polymerase sigma-70 factor (ECF subfamily)